MLTPLPKAPRPTHPETKAPTLVEVVEGPAQLRRFQQVLAMVYWHDPYHVSPLLSAERTFLDPQKNPFFAHAEARLFLAKHGNEKDVGRIAAALDRDAAPGGKPRGTFGFFEFLGDARLPEHLFEVAAAWLRERGAGEIVGPCSLAPHHFGAGLLVENFDDDPVFGTSYNPINYPGFFARLPLEKWRDLYGYELSIREPPERLARAAADARKRGLTIRPLDPARLERDLEAARAIYNEAWKEEAGFAPVREDEWRFLTLGVPFALDPALFLFVEENGRPVGFSWSFPDWNRVLKHLNGRLLPFGWIKALLLKRAIDRARVFRLGVLDAAERGERTAALVEATWRAIAARGFRRAEVAHVPEENRRAIGLLEGLGARRTRTWRLFRAT
jgi:ribosomal protein S18 acetylase RimI-like enzyme